MERLVVVFGKPCEEQQQQRHNDHKQQQQQQHQQWLLRHQRDQQRQEQQQTTRRNQKLKRIILGGGGGEGGEGRGREEGGEFEGCCHNNNNNNNINIPCHTHYYHSSKQKEQDRRRQRRQQQRRPRRKEPYYYVKGRICNNGGNNNNLSLAFNVAFFLLILSLFTTLFTTNVVVVDAAVALADAEAAVKSHSDANNIDTDTKVGAVSGGGANDAAGAADVDDNKKNKVTKKSGSTSRVEDDGGNLRKGGGGGGNTGSTGGTSSSTGRGRFGRRRKDDLSSILFPGVSPEEYFEGDEIPMWVEAVDSKKTQVPYQYYTLPVCPPPVYDDTDNNVDDNNKDKNNKPIKPPPRYRKNLGQKLSGYNLKPSRYIIHTMQNTTCTPICMVKIGSGPLRWLRQLVERQYRIHLNLDNLPILMRSVELNYAVRGYPIGFKAPPSYTHLDHDEYFLYNHIRFVIHYNNEDEKEFDGVRIVGFDAHPVSIKHELENSNDSSGNKGGGGVHGLTSESKVKTCNNDDQTTKKQKPIVNHLDTFLPIKEEDGQDRLDVIYSYEVQWIKSNTYWSDRWDIYMVGAPDDEIHIFSLVNALMMVVLLTGAVATIMLRTLKRDISTFNELHAMGGGGGGGSGGGTITSITSGGGGGGGTDSTTTPQEDEGGWKLMHGDVFRPPQNKFLGTVLCVAVGTGAQIGTAVLLTLLCLFLGILSTMNKGQTLTCIIILYVLSGSIAGYVSSRLFKFFYFSSFSNVSTISSSSSSSSSSQTSLHHRNSGGGGDNNKQQQTFIGWKRNTILTACTFPFILMTMFIILDIFLSVAGAATAVSLWTIVALFLLWICVSTPLVFVGSFIGFKERKLKVPVKTNQIARVVPENTPWYTKMPYCVLLGGLLPFGNIAIEVYFIMGALWLHQIYYVMGFLFIVMLILAATCAEMSIVMLYLQLCSEDYNWWWKSFCNCASVGLYLFGYSLWFLVDKLDLVGILPTMVYLTYMSMISMAFGLFCGCVGVVSSFWFVKTIYGALKVD